MIKLNEVHKIYNENTPSMCHAIRGITLSINKGEMLAIKGRSGSGKTTLLNIIGCVDVLTKGEYFLDGADVSKMDDKELSELRNRYFGFVMQDFGLILNDTALENVSLPLYFGKEKLKNIRHLSELALSKVNMQNYINKKTSQLSGGQKQRVAIARAIVTNPNVILADEPTGALDSKTAEEIMALLRELNKEGKTVIIVTHDEKVVSYCDRVVNLFDGEIV